MRDFRFLVGAFVLVGVLAFGLGAVLADAPAQRASLPVRAIPLDGSPSHLILDQGKLYVSSFHGDSLTVCDARKRRILQKLHLDAYEELVPQLQDGREVGKKREVRLYPPGDLVAANGKLFVGQVFSDSVVVFDLATMWVVKRLPVGGEGNFAARAHVRGNDELAASLEGSAMQRTKVQGLRRNIEIAFRNAHQAAAEGRR